jgi:cell division initiation protein
MKRFSIVNNGYNIDEVNNFIDIVIKKLEKLSADNNNYLIQLEQLKKQVANNQVISNNSSLIDNQVTKALLAAQETTDKMKELAKEEATLIIKEAKENANAIIHESLVNAQKTEQEYELLKKNYNVYRTKIESLTKAQLELLKETEEK